MRWDVRLCLSLLLCIILVYAANLFAALQLQDIGLHVRTAIFVITALWSGPLSIEQ